MHFLRLHGKYTLLEACTAATQIALAAGRAPCLYFAPHGSGLGKVSHIAGNVGVGAVQIVRQVMKRTAEIARLRALAGRWTLCLLLLATVVSQVGCVKRRMTIRSDPPGALVYVDNVQIGTTPASVSYTYYGTRQIRLVRDGYETLTVDHTFYPPWYELPGLDFVSENVVPWEIRDERTLNFKLLPQRLVPVDQLLERGENLRRGSRVQLVPETSPPVQVLPTLPSQQPLPDGVGGVLPGAMPPQ